MLCVVCRDCKNGSLLQADPLDRCSTYSTCPAPTTVTGTTAQETATNKTATSSATGVLPAAGAAFAGLLTAVVALML